MFEYILIKHYNIISELTAQYVKSRETNQI